MVFQRADAPHAGGVRREQAAAGRGTICRAVLEHLDQRGSVAELGREPVAAQLAVTREGGDDGWDERQERESELVVLTRLAVFQQFPVRKLPPQIIPQYNMA